MSIREVYYRTFSFFEDIQPHAVWEISFFNTSFQLERYGSHCVCKGLKLKRNGREMYSIVINPRYEFDGDSMMSYEDERRDVGERRECFFHRFARQYFGNQFSFVEFIQIVGHIERIPNSKELGQVAEQWGLPILDSQTERLYRRNLWKMVLASNWPK